MADDARTTADSGRGQAGENPTAAVAQEFQALGQKLDSVAGAPPADAAFDFRKTYPEPCPNDLTKDQATKLRAKLEALLNTAPDVIQKWTCKKEV
jgi:hypothetical protein